MRYLITIASLLSTLMGIGTLGFRFFSGLNWIDSLYFSVITLTTVGFSDPPNLGPGGKLFVIFYLIIGLGVFSYSVFQVGAAIVNAELRKMFERRKMQKRIDEFRNHYIVCGLGRMGRTICSYLQERHKTFVVIERDAARAEKLCKELEWPYVLGDATDDEVLRQAGIERARSLASVLPTDADNVYVVLSARMLNSGLQIVARAGDDKAVEKIERAGASRVISPFSSGAVKIARIMISPAIEDFLEVAHHRGADWELADVQIGESSPYVGKQLKETDLREKGIIVIGINRAGGEQILGPPGTAEIRAGDSLFAFGSAAAVGRMVGETGR